MSADDSDQQKQKVRGGTSSEVEENENESGLESVISCHSTDTSTKTSSSTRPHSNSVRAPSHSLLTSTNALSGHRKGSQAGVEQTSISMDTPSISMPPPSSKPASIERRISTSMRTARRSEELDNSVGKSACGLVCFPRSERYIICPSPRLSFVCHVELVCFLDRSSTYFGYDQRWRQRNGER